LAIIVLIAHGGKGGPRVPVGLREEHESLRRSAADWLSARSPSAVIRDRLEGPEEPPTPGWAELAGLGWLGLHLPEPAGVGYGLLELCVVIEQAGRAMLPGQLLPTVLLSTLLRRYDDAGLLAALADGSCTGTVAWRAGELHGTETPDGVRLAGVLSPVLCPASSARLLVPARVDGSRRWYLLMAEEFSTTSAQSLDLTRRVGAVTVDEVVLPATRAVDLDDAAVDAAAALLVAAEAAGLAGWCLETAAAHARVREQFGHPIGHFQAVKHGCADMLVRSEQAAAAVWDAAIAADTCDDAAEVLLAAEVAVAVAVEAAYDNAKRCIQLLGGIGFTWEHDAQLYLRRATAMRALVGGADPWRVRIAQTSQGGVRRRPTLELPAEADEVRARIRAEVAGLVGLEPEELRRQLALGGWLEPHLPAPAGREASPLEQLIISDELAAAGIERPHLEVGAWALPTLLEHGTSAQQERWVLPTLLGEIAWCQLFSEPSAGSDLAALTTSAREVEGGFVVNGQKVWTTGGMAADFGILLARTAPDRPRHRGLSYFVLDMRTPGVDVRPLRELTGEAMFSEVFFTDVFVPSEYLVGDLHDGWAVTRSTLAAERVSISAGTSFGGGLDELVKALAARPRGEVVDARLGDLIAEAQTVALLGLRSTSRALTGSVGAEAAIRKLIGAENEQRVLELGMDLLDAEAMQVGTPAAATWVGGFLGGRCLTIAGGTSEVQRNVIAERMLGLPRDVGRG
jgi:alkylation response protein AidB-like acyl-CoA dehydrogenase